MNTTKKLKQKYQIEIVKEERRGKKAYIVWDDNDSFDGSEKEINLLSKDYESDENISQED